MHATVELADIAADVLARIRDRVPRVHCITNSVAQKFTANMLLAAGAVPSMTIVAARKSCAFVAGADALLVNLGTFDRERRERDRGRRSDAAKAAQACRGCSIRFLSRSRRHARNSRAQLLTRGPAVVRLNHAEFATLADDRRGRRRCASSPTRTAPSIALTGGETDLTDGGRHAIIANGDPLMSLVTAMGCAGSALVVCRARRRTRRLACRPSRRLTFSALPAKWRRTARAGRAVSRPRSSTRSIRSTARRCAQRAKVSVQLASRRSAAQRHHRSRTCRRPRSGRSGARASPRAGATLVQLRDKTKRDAAHGREGARDKGGARALRSAAPRQRPRRRGARGACRRRAYRPGRHGAGGRAARCSDRTRSSASRSRRSSEAASGAARH